MNTNGFVLLHRFLLTRLSRGVTPLAAIPDPDPAISTHTPLARRDLLCYIFLGFQENFYSHASREA